MLLSTAVEQILPERTDWIFVPGSLLCWRHRDEIIEADATLSLCYGCWIEFGFPVCVRVCVWPGYHSFTLNSLHTDVIGSLL